MTGENSKHSNMPAKPVHTPHVRTTSTCRRTSSVRSCPYNSEISLMELNGIPRFDVLCRKLMTLRYKEESPQLVAHHADQYRKHLYASQKARVFYDVVVGRVFPAFRLFQDRQTVFYFLCLTHNMGDKDTAFPFIFCIFV